MTERRKFHQFVTVDHGSFDQMLIAYRSWLDGLPGKLFSESPAWWDARVRVAITVENVAPTTDHHRDIYVTKADPSVRWRDHNPGNAA